MWDAVDDIRSALGNASRVLSCDPVGLFAPGAVQAANSVMNMAHAAPYQAIIVLTLKGRDNPAPQKLIDF